MTRTIRAALVAAMSAAALVAASTPGYADDDPDRERRREVSFPLEIEVDPLREDAFITDEMEAQETAIPTGVSCTYETVQTSVNVQPTYGSTQLLYVLPSNVTATSSMDVPRSCSDGSVRYSSLARSSRNQATWMANANVGMNIRTINLVYTHNFTGAQYSTRVVKRFRSSASLATWNASAMYDASDESSPRLTRLRNELWSAGFRVAKTKYQTLLDAGSPERCTTTTSGTRCGWYAGIAETGGEYSLTNRYMVTNTGTRDYQRFGCATGGDISFAHETTHTLGASHVTDHARDMTTFDGGGGSTFRSSPVSIWDYGRNHYHPVVKAGGYVGLSNLKGNYYTC